MCHFDLLITTCRYRDIKVLNLSLITLHAIVSAVQTDYHMQLSCPVPVCCVPRMAVPLYQDGCVDCSHV